MKSSSFTSYFLSAILTLVFAASARSEENVSTIKFSDPTKAGTVKVILARGDLQIRGDDTAEVAVKSDPKAVTKAPRKDGLRVLSESSSFGLTEKDNLITLDALAGGWPGAHADFRLTVPRATTVIVANSYGGNIACEGVTGDIEIKSINGQVTLTDVSSGAIVETANGEIVANVRELHDGKPLSFTSMNGEVTLRLPAETKANVRLRTQNGSILTDFDEKALVTKTESVARVSRKGLSSDSRSDLQNAVRDVVKASVDAAHEIAAAAQEAALAARSAADAARAEARASGTKPMPPVPPIPPLPPMTGGKLVYGTLNGGGPEIGVTTMSGDVTLRRLDSKK